MLTIPMLFNSLAFLVFLPVTVGAYFLAPARFRWIVLLLAGYYFYYTFTPIFLLLLIASTIVTYVAALSLDPKRTGGALAQRWLRRAIFGITLAFHLALLLFFKYFNFLSRSVADLLGWAGHPVQPYLVALLLPVGISFFSFQKMSYLFDVYAKRIPAERHVGVFAVYSCFFPQLVAGPIERAKHLLPQLRAAHAFSYPRTVQGGLRILWGFLKKVVIADRLGIIVSTVFAAPHEYTGLALILASVCFAVQLYCDFSAYTDIALGSARILGFELVENFRKPFLSRSIADFWRRWHLSLSNWFQDYVFNPLYLSLQRLKPLKRFPVATRHWIAFPLAVLTGDFLLGLWHGANWTYAVFGLYHGALIVVYYATRRWWDRTPAFVQVSFTAGLVVIGFIIFRAASLHDAYYIITHLGLGLSAGIHNVVLGMGLPELLVTLLLTVAVLALELVPARTVPDSLAASSVGLRWSAAAAITLVILIFGLFTSTQFIYFQF